MKVGAKEDKEKDKQKDQVDEKEVTSKGSCRSWEKMVKSLDDGKVKICQCFFLVLSKHQTQSKSSKRKPKRQSAIQNVKGRSKMSKLS